MHKDSNDLHELAHRLCQELEDTITAFIEKNGNNMSSTVILSATEMLAEVWSSISIDRGLPEEVMMDLITDARSMCYRSHYLARRAEVVGANDPDEVTDESLN